jgi:hypothetical protein
MEGEINPRWLAAIDALMHCRTHRAAAKRAEVPERTLSSWLADPAFCRLLSESCRQVYQASIAQLQADSRAARAALRRNLTCGRGAVEVAAARTILESGSKLDLAALAERIEELEQRIAQRGRA